MTSVYHKLESAVEQVISVLGGTPEADLNIPSTKQ